MVTDVLGNAGLYAGLGPGIAAALDWLGRTDVAAQPDGRRAIAGDAVYAIIQRYATKRRAADGLWEAHRRYADVQYVAAGVETIGYAHVGALAPARAYSPEDDCALFSGEGDFLAVRAGMFAVFFPEDAHMPGLACGEPAEVLKVVVKVAL